MSLLLDALQRASREKEKLAEERAAVDNAVQEGEPAAPARFPALAIDFGSDAPNVVPATTLTVPAPVEPTILVSDLTQASPPATASGIEPHPATTPVELTLDPMPAIENATPAVAGRTAAPPPVFAQDPRVEPAQEVARLRVESSGAARSPVAEAASAPPAAGHPSPAASPQVAREILSATAKPARSRPNRRLLVLGALALLVAVANAAFFMGFLDSFLGMSGSGLTPSLPPPPLAVATPPPPPQEAIAAAGGQAGAPAALPPDAKASAAKAALIPAASPQAAARAAAPRDEDSVAAAPVASRRARPRSPAARAPGSGPAKPVFVAKPAAASVLDTAYAALTEGRFDEAADDYKRALARSPGERDALLGLAYIAQHQGRRDEARAYYQQVLRQEPGHPGAYAGLLSIAAEGDLQLTASRAREMAERNPDSAVVMSTLGGILAKEGRIAEAQQAYFRALTLEPDSAFHAYNLAVALDRLHKNIPAQGYYQRALALAEKSSAADQADFPRRAALLRLEQLRNSDANPQTTSPPESGRR